MNAYGTRQLAYRTLAAVCLSACAPAALPFAEDACAAHGGGWENCAERPCDPRQSNARCQTIAMLTTVRSQHHDKAVGARSTVHFDATYYLAQAAGFAPRAALTIAAYDQAVDTGRFWLRGEDGRLLVAPRRCEIATPPPACGLSSRSIAGANRNDFAGGGVFFHFMPPAEGQFPIDGLRPRLDADEEPFLAHLRRWAEGGEPLCVGGLTRGSPAGDYALGSACYPSSRRKPATLVGRIPSVTELGFVGSVEWTARIEAQRLAPDTEGGTPRPASRLGAQFGAEATLVRLGILLHAVQDRISHHRCLDVSAVHGPRPADAGEIVLNPLPYALYQLFMNGSTAPVRERLSSVSVKADPAFVFDFDRAQCDQPQHALRHTWETGYPQARLPAADRTTGAALRMSLDLLRRSAPGDGARQTPLPAEARAQIVNALTAALETRQAQARIAALGRLARAQGWTPLPAHAGLAADDWISQVHDAR